MANPSYAYAVGSVRARENALLTRADVEQLLGEKTLGQLLDALQSKGIGNGDTTDIEELLRQETAATWQYLREITPDFSLYNVFIYRNDYHNLKVTLKGVLSGRAFKHLLLNPVTVAPSVLEEAVGARRFDALPAHMRDAAQKAYDLLAHTADVPLCDAILDRAAMHAMQTAAREANIPLLTSWCDTFVFYSNVKIALRAAKAHKPPAYLDAALCAELPMPAQDLKEAALNGEEAVLELLEQRNILDSRTAAEQYRLSPSAFERFADDRLMRVARIGRTTTLGAEPLIGYLLAKEAQHKAIHILASGLRAGQAESTIRERLREMYG